MKFFNLVKIPSALENYADLIRHYFSEYCQTVVAALATSYRKMLSAALIISRLTEFHQIDFIFSALYIHQCSDYDAENGF